MKCPTCNGLGKIRLMPFNYVCTCAECKGTGETKDWPTNEEYIRQASTEELAKICAEIYLGGATAEEGTIDMFKKWLQEKHK